MNPLAKLQKLENSYVRELAPYLRKKAVSLQHKIYCLVFHGHIRTLQSLQIGKEDRAHWRCHQEITQRKQEKGMTVKKCPFNIYRSSWFCVHIYSVCIHRTFCVRTAQTIASENVEKETVPSRPVSHILQTPKWNIFPQANSMRMRATTSVRGRVITDMPHPRNW